MHYKSINSISFHSDSRWNLASIHNVELLNTSDGDCTPSSDGGVLLFFPQPPPTLFSLNNAINYTINSRQLATNSIDPRNVTWSAFKSATLPSCRPIRDHEDTNNTGNTNQTLRSTQLENIVLARITEIEEYDQILETVCKLHVCVLCHPISLPSLHAHMLKPTFVLFGRFKMDHWCQR